MYKLTFAQDSQGSVPMPSLDNIDLTCPESTPQEIAKRKIFVCFLENMSTQCQILEQILTTLLVKPAICRMSPTDKPQLRA